MKEIKPKKCKACTGEYIPRSTTQQACSPLCAIAWNKAKEAKKANREENREHLIAKKVFKASDLSVRKKAAVFHCHKYIRERDKNKGCVTCGSSLIGKKFDAGHFMKSTHSFTKFMEKNIHGQCVNCNQYNGGRELEYYQAITLMYGELTAKALMRLRSRNVKRSADDYKAIEDCYKEKLKGLS